jgi:hypothetical protein
MVTSTVTTRPSAIRHGTPFINTPMHSGISVRALHRFGHGRNGPSGRDRKCRGARSHDHKCDGEQYQADVDEARGFYAGLVANGRIYDGVHFRTSTEVGPAMGRQIGKLAAAKYLSTEK